MKRYIFTILLAIVPLIAFDSSTDTNWNYHFKNYTDMGGITNDNNVTPPFIIDQSIADAFYRSLPENQHNDLVHPEYFPSDEPEIIIQNDAEVFITFYAEGAAYRSALGYYTYDGNTSRTRPLDLNEIRNNGIILFPNASAYGSGGDMQYGTTVSLGKFGARTKILFFVVSDGWNGSRVLLNNRDEGRWNWIFSTWSPLNEEYIKDSTLTVPLHKHAAILWKKVTDDNGLDGKILLIGFEDLLRYYSDDDFNDVFISVSSSPDTALNTADFIEVPISADRDGDGVNDAFDLFPDDPERATISYYPSADGNATITFEDNWPNEGDYDMNDLVIGFNIQEVKDANQKVKDINFTGVIRAHGAMYKDGFAFKIDTSVSNIESATLNGVSIIDNIKADSDGNAIIYIFSDPSKYLNNVTLDDEGFFNVIAGTSVALSETFNVNITLKSSATLMAPPYNPFMTVQHDDYTNIEVHLPKYPSTQYAENSIVINNLIDKDIDFLTTTNKPWALLFTTTFAYPAERVNISDAYIHYDEWVYSNGTIYNDWYLYENSGYADYTKIVKPN